MKSSGEVRAALRIAALVLALVFTQLGQAQTSGPLCVPPPAGLVSWWPGEGNANDIADGNNGTLLGAVSFTVAEVGQGFTFASNGDGVTIPHNSNLNVNSPGFTADFWMKGIKNQPPEGLSTIFEKSHGWIDGTGWAFQVEAGGAMRFAIGNGGGFPEIIGTVDVLDGSFHHIAGTWDGTTMHLYIDGSSMGTASNLTPANNTRAVNIGFTWGGGTPRRFFRGTVDELDVYNRALTAAEIQSIFNAGSAGKCHPFAAGSFSAKVDITLASSAFGVNSTFTLGTGGRIAPLTQPVTIQLGTASITIPAGSFHLAGKGKRFVFSGVINGVAVDANLTPLGGSSYSLKLDAAGVANLPSSNPVTVGLTIGNNTGSRFVTASIQ